MKPAECHPDRKHYAKGMCGACYRREWVNSDPARVRAQARARDAWRARQPAGSEWARIQERERRNPSLREARLAREKAREKSYAAMHPDYSRARSAKDLDALKRIRKEIRLAKAAKL